KAFRPSSIVNISAMSFGALSAHAIQALNKGAKIAGVMHNTGEGGLSPHHKQGADVIYQIGTGKFGCRDLEGNFSLERLLETVNGYPQIRGIELKLSQGAKPGKGGVLPGKKVTPEIAAIRGVRPWHDCISPNSHKEFNDVRSMIRFIDSIAKATGLPVGVKSAVGNQEFWRELAIEMRSMGKGPDWITIDGGEGGTGAAPLTFVDHVSMPFKIGFTRVFKTFAEEKMTDKVVWIGSGKLGFPDRTIIAMALGCDMVNIAREAMLSIGCIQAQKCHTDRCPAGVTTQDPALQKGLVPEVQALRFARFCQSLRNEILAVTHACGYEHPSQFTMRDIELSAGPATFKTLEELFGYTPERHWRGIEGWGSRAAATVIPFPKKAA
ncbi:MAG: glutamate synthase-related protein, partial [Bdellovibrionota bacterium]